MARQSAALRARVARQHTAHRGFTMEPDGFRCLTCPEHFAAPRETLTLFATEQDEADRLALVGAAVAAAHAHVAAHRAAAFHAELLAAQNAAISAEYARLRS